MEPRRSTHPDSAPRILIDAVGRLIPIRAACRKLIHHLGIGKGLFITPGVDGEGHIMRTGVEQSPRFCSDPHSSLFVESQRIEVGVQLPPVHQDKVFIMSCHLGVQLISPVTILTGNIERAVKHLDIVEVIGRLQQYGPFPLADVKTLQNSLLTAISHLIVATAILIDN